MKIQFEITEEHEKESNRLRAKSSYYYTPSCDCPSVLCIKEKLKTSIDISVGLKYINLTPRINNLPVISRTVEIQQPKELREYIAWWDGKSKMKHGGIFRNPLFRPAGVFEVSIPFKEEFLKDEVICGLNLK